MLHLNRGEPERSLQWLSMADALVAEQRLAFLLEPRLLRGAALIAQGNVDDAITCLQAGLARRLGANTSRAYGLSLLGEALAKRGEQEAALTAAAESFAATEATGERWWQAELYRVKAMALLAGNQLDESQLALKEAITTARIQHAKSLELRAARDLARLWGEQGRRTEARDLLAPVYGWFTEGFDTADLKEAKALLDQLA